MRLLKTIIKWSLITLVPVLIGVAFLYSTLSKKINKDLVASLLEAKKMLGLILMMSGLAYLLVKLIWKEF